jgi:hypothetical protein
MSWVRRRWFFISLPCPRSNAVSPHFFAPQIVELREEREAADVDPISGTATPLAEKEGKKT